MPAADVVYPLLADSFERRDACDCHRNLLVGLEQPYAVRDVRGSGRVVSLGVVGRAACRVRGVVRGDAASCAGEGRVHRGMELQPAASRRTIAHLGAEEQRLRAGVV